MRINYTTYDVRRAQDVISRAANRNNVMVLKDRTGEDRWSHPYAYAHVLGIFHVNVLPIDGGDIMDTRPQRMEFLWVRWFRLEDEESDSWQTRRLDAVSFPSVNDPDAFSFLDPADVVRSCYVVPVFHEGQRHTSGKGLSHVCRDGADWKRYHIQR